MWSGRALFVGPACLSGDKGQIGAKQRVCLDTQPSQAERKEAGRVPVNLGVRRHRQKILNEGESHL